mgnify:FL=1
MESGDSAHIAVLSDEQVPLWLIAGYMTVSQSSYVLDSAACMREYTKLALFPYKRYVFVRTAAILATPTRDSRSTEMDI